jgi:hypothetical protein
MPDKIVPIKASTQSFTEIETIEHDLVMFTQGSCVMVVSTTAVNFGLLSEKEQDAIIYAYAGLLNSLSFPIEILIRTQQKDVSAYLKTLEDGEKKQKNPKLASSMHSYRQFVAATVRERNVLDKKFYVVLPFSYLELGTSASVLFGGSKKHGLPFPKEYILERALTVLTPKKDHVIRLLGRIGLRAKQLDDEQLTRLFFEIYNQGAPPLTHEDIQKITYA